MSSQDRKCYEKYGFFPSISHNLIRRNFMNDVRQGNLNVEQINKEIEAAVNLLEELKIEAIEKLNLLNGCTHQYGRVTGETMPMVLGDMRNTWRRTCSKCGKGDVFSCMDESKEERPEWTADVKLRFIPNY